MLRLEALAKGVKRTRPDVAIDDAEREEGQFCETAAGRVGFDVSLADSVSFDGNADFRDLKRLFHAFRIAGGL